MACEPDLDVLVLVSGVVVEDGMDRDAGGYRVRDAVEASQERLVVPRPFFSGRPGCVRLRA